MNTPVTNMRNQRFYLGIDGGGTKTTAAILDEKGTERGRGSGGSGNLVNTRPEILRQSLRDAVRTACQNAQLPEEVHFNGACAGMAGYSAEANRAAFATLFANEIHADNPTVEPDFSIAYWGATHGEPGIVVIAGTGAVAYGRNADGETRREDGLGFLLGDRGSGFNLGLRVLQYTLELWKAGDKDALTEAVLAHTGAASQEQIVQWLYGDFSPGRVAALAPIVGQLAQDGEPAACWHVADMARRLRHSVRQVRHHLWLSRETPVYPLGGLWNLGEFIREEFAEPLWSGEGRFAMPSEGLTGGKFVIAQPQNDAAYGAALLAQVKDTSVQVVS